TARVMKLVERRRGALLGVIRQAANGSFRLEPVERRQAEMVIEPGDLEGARPGDLVEVEQHSAGRYGLARGKVVTLLGSLSSEKAISMIAIHAHGIPHIFPADVIAEATAAEPDSRIPRE